MADPGGAPSLPADPLAELAKVPDLEAKILSLSLLAKSFETERDHALAEAEGLRGRLRKADTRAALAEGRLKASDAEARMKERDALRAEVSRAHARQAELEGSLREKETALGQATLSARRHMRETEAVKSTVGLIQAARDQAQRDEARALRERDGALSRIAELESEVSRLSLKAAELEHAARKPDTSKPKAAASAPAKAPS